MGKILKMVKKVGKHYFKNMDFKSHKDPYLEYICEGMDARLKKNMKKSNRGQHRMVCS